MPSHQKLHVFQPIGLGFGAVLQGHFKLPTLHPQTLHGLGNGLSQARCGLGSGCSDRLSRLHKGK